MIIPVYAILKSYKRGPKDNMNMLYLHRPHQLLSLNGDSVGCVLTENQCNDLMN